MPCKLDSTENPRSFEKYPNPPWLATSQKDLISPCFFVHSLPTFGDGSFPPYGYVMALHLCTDTVFPIFLFLTTYKRRGDGADSERIEMREANSSMTGTARRRINSSRSSISGTRRTWGVGGRMLVPMCKRTRPGHRGKIDGRTK